MRFGQLLWTQWPPAGPHHVKQSTSVEHWGSILQATGVKSSEAGGTAGPASGALTTAPPGAALVVLSIVAATPAAVTNSNTTHTM
jgi:hypothetical protein